MRGNVKIIAGSVGDEEGGRKEKTQYSCSQQPCEEEGKQKNPLIVSLCSIESCYYCQIKAGRSSGSGLKLGFIRRERKNAR